MGTADSKPKTSDRYLDTHSSSLSLQERKKPSTESSLTRSQPFIPTGGGLSNNGSTNALSFFSPHRKETEVRGSPFIQGGTGGGEFIATEALPFHVDSRSVVYAPSSSLVSPALELHREPTPSSPYSSSEDQQREWGSMLGEPLSPDSPALLEEFIIVPPPVPLLSSPTHVHPHLDVDAAEGGGQKPPSGFLATPQYNLTTGGKGEELLLHSPVLRSYHAKSFPVTAPIQSGGSHNMTTTTSTASSSTASVTTKGSFTGSTTGSSGNIGGAVAGVTTTKNIIGSMINSSGGLTSSDLSSSSSPHSRFLDIRGNPMGLENCGNTCYANSVVQLIYHCIPLRLRLLELHEAYKARRGCTGFKENTVLYAFCNLIGEMHKANNIKGGDGEKIIPTRSFLLRVAEKNPLFKGEQQDAHEFCMFLLNELMEAEKDIMRIPKNAKYFREQQGFGSNKFGVSHSSSKGSAHEKSARNGRESTNASEKGLSPLQSILQGSFVSTTACLNCGNITHCKDAFLDLSLETRQGCSLLDCLAHFGDPSLFIGSNQLKCEKCGTLANAANTIHVEELPQFALLIHLKRFRYDPGRRTFTKTAHHVVLPMEMDVEEYQMDRSSQPNNEGEDTLEKGWKEDAPSGIPSVATPEPCQSPLSPPFAWTETAQASLTSLGKKEASFRSLSPVAPAGVPFKGIPSKIRTKLEGVVERKARFELTGFVAHLGEGPSLGHYFTCTRYGPNLWRRFDDGVVTTMSRREVEQLFGVPIEASGMVTTTAYILLYERVA